MVPAQNADSPPILGELVIGENAAIEGLVMGDNFVANHDSAKQVLSTPDSLLLPSEPPDINNWFSSYAYESFVLETNDNFGFSDYQDHEVDKEESNIKNVIEAVKDSRGSIKKSENDDEIGKNITSSNFIKCKRSEEDYKYEQCLNQVSDSPDSPSLCSEPPGIKNWFSSYAYESPALDTIDDCIFSDKTESIVEKKELDTGKVIKEEDSKPFIRTTKNNDLGHKKIGSSYIFEYKEGSTANDKHGPQSVNQTNKVEKRRNLENQRPSGCANGSTKDDKNSSSSDKILAEKLQSKTTDTICKPLSINLRRRDTIDEYSEANELEATESTWKTTRSNKLEDRENYFFVAKASPSVRRKRENDENSMRNCTSLFDGQLEDEAVRRKTLKDVTNIESLNVPEITGKWKCPRKSKPYRSPPLKQLRLGQWFHRV